MKTTSVGISLLISLLAVTGCNSDNQDIEREEEFSREDNIKDAYDQKDIHPGNDILPDDLDSGVSEQ